MDGAKFRQQWLDSLRESVNPGDRSSRDRVTSNAPSSFAGFTEGRLLASTNGWIFSEDDMRAVGVRVTGVGDTSGGVLASNAGRIAEVVPLAACTAPPYTTYQSRHFHIS